MTAVHSLLVFLLLSLLLNDLHTKLDQAAVVVKKSIWAALLGGLPGILVLPHGFLLVISGQAFITSCMATVFYIIMSFQENR